MDDRAHRPQCGSWYSGRRANARLPDFESPFCASRMLVCSHDGGIDHDVLKIWVLDQGLEKTLPNTFARPTIEAHEYAVPQAECWGQIAPRSARAQNPQHRIDKQPIVLAVATFVALLTRNQIRDTLPLCIRQLASNQDRLL